MFESDCFRFAQLFDAALIERLDSKEVNTEADIEHARELECFASSILEVKSHALNSLARNMADSTETDAPAAIDMDRMHVWILVSTEMKAIIDLQSLVSKLNHYVFKHELSKAKSLPGGRL